MTRQFDLHKDNHVAPKLPKKKALPSKRSKPRAPKEPRRIQPRRTSHRIAGIAADSEVAKRKADEEAEQLAIQEQAKKVRRSGVLQLAQMLQSEEQVEDATKLLQSLTGVPLSSIKIERENGDHAVASLTDRRTALQGLEMYSRFEPNDIKITPERIYYIGMHPGVDKKLVFAGDKLGSLGIWDADSATVEDSGGADGDDEEVQPVDRPVVHSFKLHTRSITSFVFNPNNVSKVLTSSYDCSIRMFDLPSATAEEVYFPKDGQNGDNLISTVQIYPTGQRICFSTVGGMVGFRDLRENSHHVSSYILHDARKIGNLSINPTSSDYLCTASNDRSMKIWDCRKISSTATGKPLELLSYESSKSVSAAIFNERGSVVSTSYDDSVNIFDNLNLSSGKKVESDELAPSYVVPHDNQVSCPGCIMVYTL